VAAQTFTESVVNVYTMADPVARFPVEAATVFVIIAAMASAIEFAIDRLKRNESQYFQQLWAAVKQEFLVSALLTMLIVFCESVGGFSDSWIVVLNYTVLTLFFVVVIFLCLIFAIVFKLRVEMTRWRYFEGTRIDVDPKLSHREGIYKQARDRFRESVAANAVVVKSSMKFADYLAAVEPQTVSGISDMGWRAWAALAVVVIMNGVRGLITVSSDTVNVSKNQRAIDVFSFIILIGYGSLAVYLAMHFAIQNRAGRYVSEPAAVQVGDKWAVSKPVELLFFGSFDTTAMAFQVVMLIQEWYVAVLVLGMMSQVFSTFGGLGVLILIAAFLPVVIVALMMPWSVTLISMLRWLGDSLDLERVRALVGQAEENEAAALLAAAAGAAGAAAANKNKVATTAALNIAREDEWDGAPITLHQSAGMNSQLDVTSPPLRGATNTHASARRAYATTARDSQATLHTMDVRLFAGREEADDGPLLTLDGSAFIVPGLPPSRPVQQQHGWLPSRVAFSARADRDNGNNLLLDL
jgi:hypothetical protein